MIRLVLMRGLPGSGKSTLASKLAKAGPEDTLLFGADQYFTNPDNTYSFNPKNLPVAHAWTQGRIEGALLANRKHKLAGAERDLTIYVDNTHTRLWEMQHAIDLAAKYQAKLEVLYPDTSWAWDVEECFKRCTHGVPKNKIQQMMERFEFNDEYPDPRANPERNSAAADTN